MAKKDKSPDHVSETPATAWLKSHQVTYTEHPYEYLEHGGAQHSAKVLGLDPFTVVKTLVMQDQDAKPLLVLMHGNRTVSTKNLARQIGAKWLSGGWHVAFWHAQGHAGVCGGCHSGPATHRHQRWAAGFLGRHCVWRADRCTGCQARAMCAGRMSSWVP
jgi:hypothetical protein